MTFKSIQFNKNLLPKYNDIINCILYYKENAKKDKIKNFLYIQKVTTSVLEIWSRVSIEYLNERRLHERIKYIWEKYVWLNKNKKNNSKLLNLYTKYDKLFDISINEDKLYSEDYVFLMDQRGDRKRMIGNTTWSTGG